MKVGIGKNNDDKDVNLSARGLINALSVEIVDSSGNQLGGSGALSTAETTGLVPKVYDYISYTSTTLTDIYTYKTGGANGTIVATLVVTWTTSGKTVLASVART